MKGKGTDKLAPSALVIGASIAGMLAACILVDHFERVTIVRHGTATVLLLSEKVGEAERGAMVVGHGRRLSLHHNYRWRPNARMRCA